MGLILYADDRKAVGNASSVLNCHNKQTDLDAIYQWSASSRQPVNLAKCQCLHIGNGNPNYVYILGGQLIPIVEQCTDLGLICSKTFSYMSHINSIICKASRAACLIYRMFSTRDLTFLKKLYVTYVRPILEHVSPVWNSTKIGLQNDLERVQRRFTKRLRELGDMSYVDRLKHLYLDTLLDRRNHADLVTTYKALHELLGIMQ